MKLTIEIDDVAARRGSIRIDGRVLTFAHDPGQGGFYITDGAKPHTLGNTHAGVLLRTKILTDVLPALLPFAELPDVWGKLGRPK